MAMYIKDGKNLFNIDAITGVENNAARIIRKGRGIGISRGAYSSGLIFKGNEVYLPVGEYTFSAIVENDMDVEDYDYAYVALWGLTSKVTLVKMTKVYPKTKEKLVYNFSVTTADTYGFRLQGRGDAATASDMKFYYYDIQLEKGTEATAYKPYNNPQRVKVVDGNDGIRNEYNPTNHLTMSGVTFTDRDITHVNVYTREWFNTLREMCPFIKAGETYTFACTIETDVTLTVWQGRVGDMGNTLTIIPSTTTGYVKRVLTVKEEDLSKRIWAFGNNGGTVTWKNFMCVKGDYSNKEIPEWRAFSSRILNPRIFAKT